MRRLEGRDFALLAALVPLWLGFLGLHAKEVLRTGLAKPPIFVNAPESADAYPRVAGIYAGRHEAADASGLRMGDRLLEVDGTDLRGAGHVRTEALFTRAARTGLRVPVRFARGTREEVTLVPLVRAYDPAWGRLPAIALSGIAAIVILLRSPSARQGRATFAPTMLWLCLISDFGGGPLLQTYVWKAVHPPLAALVIPLVVRWAQEFPEELPPGRRWLHAWPWLFAPAHLLLRGGYYYGWPVPPEQVSSVVAATDGASAAAFLAALSLSYRRAGAVGRRQLKWVLYGFYVGLLPFGVVALLAGVLPAGAWRVLFGISSVLTVGCVIGVLVAIVRYQLFDIDRLISTTASYTLLGVAVATVVLTVVQPLAESLSPALGLDDGTARILLSVVLASVAVPANRRLRPAIDRVFFAERYALERGVARVLHELPECHAPRELFTRAGEGLDALVRPESCVLYSRTGLAFTPVFVRGSAVPSAFPAGGGLVAALVGSPDPIAAESWTRPRAKISLGDLERAALDTLAVALVGPIRRGAGLAAFLCLGRKRSGDIYTNTDQVLVGAVCDRLGVQLVRFDESELMRRQLEIYAELRRYVPGAVAAKLERGERLAPMERDVSVLFVDIRGYTTYAEPRAAPDVFSTVTRYTDGVSGIVQKHGGNVVEFHGDGLMAVFGAPDALAHKERAAVAAAIEIVRAVPEMGATTGGAEPLRVGVGIATGRAFVGSIQSADRWIWSAIGDTTNLAARLQALTRDLGASVVIDARTRERAGDLTARFRSHPAQPIRGRSRREDLASWSG